MTREDLKLYINDAYSVQPERLWMKFPTYEVFRHFNNQKWFALVMEVPKNKLGISQNGCVDIVNLKCDPLMIGSLRMENGVFPAYHMNKENWVSVALNEGLSDEMIKTLLDISFEITSV